MLRIRAVLIDIDGVLTVSWQPPPGAVAALHRLRAAGLPLALVPNTTSRTRASIASTLAGAGFPVAAGDILTAPVIAAAYLHDRYPGARCLLLSSGDITEDLAGLTLAQESDPAPADVVLVGGAGPEFSYQALNQAFGHLQRGARLVAMHRGLYWRTSEGLQLDAGANRAGFGSAGTCDDSAPHPQLRDLPVTDASTRAMLAVVTGPSGGDKAAAEQALLDRALTEFAWVFTKKRLFVMDRNFPGIARIRRMIQVTHVLIRLKSDITVTKAGDFLPDGSYMADIGGKDQKIRMRVIEYYVHVDGQDVPEMFCLVTDLHDWQAHPASALAAAYKWRWDGSETALREAKSAIRGAGPSTGPIFRSHCPDMIRQEHAAWITGTELVRAAARQAARLAIPARKGRRTGQPAHPREISFTAARRAAITSIRTGAATASLPAAITAARRQATLRDLGRRRVTIDRDRHRDHKTKARQAFPAAGRGTATRKAPATITLCGPIAA